jgi:hypothetical protein
MASHNGNIMYGDKDTADRLTALTAPSLKEQSPVVHGHILEKSEHDSQPVHEKASSESPCDMETAGLRAPAAKRGLFRVFSPQNPYIWPYLAWVSIEVAGLISDYLLLKMFGRSSSERVSYPLVRGSGI